MGDELVELRAENERLRSLLEEYGIDPDPAPPEPPQFGPPTAWEWQMQQISMVALRFGIGRIVSGIIDPPYLSK